MKNRNSITCTTRSLIGCLASLLLVAACPVRASEKPADVPPRPNVIIILSDDLSYCDLGYTGQKLIQTPNIDRLAAGGMRFVEGYSAAPVCTASRAGLITGMHMGHCRIRGNAIEKPKSDRPERPFLKPEDVTVAEVLKSAGYATGYVGKWALGSEDTAGSPGKKGFDYSFGFYDPVSNHSYYPKSLWENGKSFSIPENLGYKGQGQNTEADYDAQGNYRVPGVADPAKAKYSQDLVHAAGKDFIRRNKEQPFFLYYATQLPHGKLCTPNLGIYKDKPWPTLQHKEWAAMVTGLDHYVGDLVALLRELKLEENTLIVFASDNGYSAYAYLGNKPHWQDDPLFKNKGPWPGGKFAVYEGGCRVPMFAYWPKHVQPGESRQLLAFYDLMPTLAELAGVASPPCDGISLVPTLLGQPEQQKQHDYLYWENGGAFTRHGQAVRFGPWYAMRERPNKSMTLFDVEKDLACTQDLAVKHPDLVERAKAMFKEAHVDSEWYTNPGESESSTTQKETGKESIE